MCVWEVVVGGLKEGGGGERFEAHVTVINTQVLSVITGQKTGPQRLQSYLFFYFFFLLSRNNIYLTKHTALTLY